MPRHSRDVVALRKRATNSLILGIELFNRPMERGRAEAVIILIHHSFEMLLKAAIKKETGVVHSKNTNYAYGFRKCLEIAHNKLQLIDESQRTFLNALNMHRDIAVHYYQAMSENMLYIQAQGGVSLFDSILYKVFVERLADEVPTRILPVSTKPPTSLQLLLDSELSQVDQFLTKGSRKGAIAAARLRPIMALAAGVGEDGDPPSERDVQHAVARRRRGEEWTVILPEVAELCFATRGEGIPMYVAVKKDAAAGVRVVSEGEPVEGTLIKQEINIWDKYSMGRDDLAGKLGITGPRTGAIIIELGIQDEPGCFKKLRRKKSEFKGYSKKSLDRIREALDNGLDVDEVWQKHRHRFGSAKRSSVRR